MDQGEGKEKPASDTAEAVEKINPADGFPSGFFLGVETAGERQERPRHQAVGEEDRGTRENEVGDTGEFPPDENLISQDSGRRHQHRRQKGHKEKADLESPLLTRRLPDEFCKPGPGARVKKPEGEEKAQDNFISFEDVDELPDDGNLGDDGG